MGVVANAALIGAVGTALTGLAALRIERVRVREQAEHAPVLLDLGDDLEHGRGTATAEAAAQLARERLHPTESLAERARSVVEEHVHPEVERDRVEAAAVDDSSSCSFGLLVVEVDRSANERYLAGDVAIVCAGARAGVDERVPVLRVRPDCGADDTRIGSKRAEGLGVVCVDDLDGELAERAIDRRKVLPHCLEPRAAAARERPTEPASAGSREDLGNEAADVAGRSEQDEVVGPGHAGVLLSTLFAGPAGHYRAGVYRLDTIADKLKRLGADPGDAPAEHHGPSAAVAAILRQAADGDSAELLFIQRAESPKDLWSGHIAFPGGRRDPEDTSLLATAIRETREEVAIELAAAELVARLPDVPAFKRTMKGLMVVTPFVFVVRREVTPTPNDEVAATLWVPLEGLARGEGKGTYAFTWEEKPYELPCYRLGPGQHVLWGMTHRMVETMLEALASS